MEKDQVVQKLEELLELIAWGSIEVQIQNGKVVQITKREILRDI